MFPDWLTAQRDRLFELIERGQLPHAILIHGPAGTGRRLLALSIVARLLDTPTGDGEAALGPGVLVDEESAPMHPDFRLVQPPPDKRVIPVDRVRELIEFLGLTPHQSGHKAVLLNPAHAMNRHAANSLLKTLEEPPGSSVILLVTDSLSRLTPTIVSRCQRVRVAMPAPKEALDWLAARAPGADWTEALALAAGAPVRALEYERSNVREQVSEFAKDIEALESRRTSPAAVARRWARADPEVYLTWLYQRISDEIREALPLSAETGRKSGARDLQKSTENLTMERAFAELRRVGELRRLQGSGLNADLQLSDILTRWYGRVG